MGYHPTGRGQAAYLDKRHGAWFIMLHETDEGDGNSTPDELYFAAGSLATAKRVAREQALELGWTGPFYWAEDDRAWRLTATDSQWVMEDE